MDKNPFLIVSYYENNKKRVFSMNQIILIFFITLICSVATYYLIPLKYRWIVLLVASVVFYAIISTNLTPFICFTAISVWMCAKYIDKKNNSDEDINAIKRKNKTALIFVILLNLGIIVFLKFYPPVAALLNSVFKTAGLKANFPSLKLIAPLGISFYTLQAIGYLTDVYRQKIRAERNFFKVALFLSFFPQILEGPIAKYDQTADQLYKGHCFDYKTVSFGAQRIIWGLFKKMVVADRLYLLVKTVSDKPSEYVGIASLLLILFYTLQLYADFSGFVDIAVGSAEMFGIKLPENFRQPFFAKSAQEFWQRWHISLGVWLKEYIFYSVALSPKLIKFCSKLKKKHKNHFTKILPTLISLFFVWLCNGLWHGAKWNYIVYGMYYFAIISAGMTSEPLFKRLYSVLKINPEGKLLSAFRHIRTLLIIFIGETIFGATSLKNTCITLTSVFKPWRGSMFSLGLDYKEFLVAVIGIALIFTTDFIKEKGINIRECIAVKKLPIRWSAYMTIIIAIVLFGAYGGMYSLLPFIYGNF